MHAAVGRKRRTCHVHYSEPQVKDSPHAPQQATSEGLAMCTTASREQRTRHVHLGELLSEGLATCAVASCE